MSDVNTEDNAQGRFAARVMIVIALLVFVFAVSFVLFVSKSGEVKVANVVEDVRAGKRMDELAEVVKEQQLLMTRAAVVGEPAENRVRIPVKDGMKLVIPALKAKKAGPTKIVVPGSPTQLEQAKADAAKAKNKEGAKEEGKASGEGKGDKAPAETPKKK